jgi:hypothetical protein
VTGKAKGTTVSQYDFQAASGRLQVVIHTKFAVSLVLNNMAISFNI